MGRSREQEHSALTRERIEGLSIYSSRPVDAADFTRGHLCLIASIFSIRPGKAQQLGWNRREGKRQHTGLEKKSEPVTEPPTVNQMSSVSSTSSTASSTELVNTVFNYTLIKDITGCDVIA